MKTLELKLKKNVLIVDENDFDYYELFKDGIYLKLKNGDRDYIEGNFELLCKGSDLTEEIASELVDKSIHTGLYAYYVDNIPVNAYCYNSAKEAVISKVESKGFHWLENPISLDRAKLYESIGDTFRSKGIKKEWQKAEEKTLRNPLIFVKK